MRAAAQAAESTAGSPLEQLRARATSKSGKWQPVRPAQPAVEELGVALECADEAGDERSCCWRAACTVTGIEKANAVALLALLLGEETFTRSSADRDCFFATFDLHEGGASKRNSGARLASPTSSSVSSAVSSDRPHYRSPLEFARSFSGTIPRAAAAVRSSYQSSDEDGNTDNDEAETEETAKVSFSRRISRIAAARLRSMSRSPRHSDPETPRSRKLRFLRNVTDDCVFCTDDEYILEPFDEDNMQRARISCLGGLVETLLDGENGVRVTVVMHIDPQFDRWELGGINADALSSAIGKARLENLMLRLVQACRTIAIDTSAQEWLKNRLSWAGDTIFNEPWEERRFDREAPHIGCIVRHPQHGTGVIESFDMRGTFKVRYEAEDAIVVHGPEEKEKLKVLLDIGHRVRHRDRGTGTVHSIHHTDAVRVQYDDGRQGLYAKEGWHRRLRRINDEEPLLKFFQAKYPGVIEGIARVSFVVYSSAEDVQRDLLRRSEHVCPHETMDVTERKVLHKVSNTERIIWEQRKMPGLLTPRSFVYRETHGECLSARLILRESSKDYNVPDTQGVVRGFRICDGWVIEPLPAISGCYVTRILCLDLAGFLAPEALCSVRETMLIMEALAMIYRNCD